MAGPHDGSDAAALRAQSSTAIRFVPGARDVWSTARSTGLRPPVGIERRDRPRSRSGRSRSIRSSTRTRRISPARRSGCGRRCTRPRRRPSRSSAGPRPAPPIPIAGRHLPGDPRRGRRRGERVRSLRAQRVRLPAARDRLVLHHPRLRPRRRAARRTASRRLRAGRRLRGDDRHLWEIRDRASSPWWTGKACPSIREERWRDRTRRTSRLPAPHAQEATG
jgi:hypothetical protein